MVWECDNETLNSPISDAIMGGSDVMLVNDVISDVI